MENYGHLNHFAEQTFRASFYLLWPCLAICSVYCSNTNTSALNVCFNFQLYHLSLLALLQFEQFMRHLILAPFQVTSSSLLQQHALAHFKPLCYSVTQPDGFINHVIFLLWMRCWKRNMVMEGSISGVLEQSFLYKDCCYFAFEFHPVMHPGFIFSSDSNSTKQYQMASTSDLFSVLCVCQKLFVLCTVFQSDASGIKCCNCTLYYKRSSVIPYTPASVELPTCLCFTSLIDISFLPDTFR